MGYGLRAGCTSGDVQYTGNQCGMAPLPLVPSHMLDRGAADLPDELRQSRLVHEMAAATFNADGAHVLQSFDQGHHGGRHCRLRHLSEPGQPAQTALVPTLSECIEKSALLGGKSLGQPTMSFPTCTVPQINAHPFQHRRRRGNDTPLAARVHY